MQVLKNSVDNGAIFDAGDDLHRPTAVRADLNGQEEDRWFTLGTSSDGKLLAVAHTFQEQSDSVPATVRIISARPATRHEREQYENEPR